MSSKGISNNIGTPIPEIAVDEALVHSLLQEQHPDLQHLSIKLVDMGWDNAIFRLGDRLSVRVPLRQLAAKLIQHEQTWLPLLAAKLPIPVPSPYRIGKPTKSYPWGWSVLPWLTGVAADQEEPHAHQAKLFGSFLLHLHMPAPPNAPVNPGRGVPLNQRAAAVEERLQRLRMKTNLITPAIRNTWDRALNIPIDTPAKWLHGDLHARNVLVERGIITGVIDWGDITSGDIATDLASIWMLFGDRDAREQAIAEYGSISEATLQRAKGWGILFGIILLDTGLVDNPRHAVMGERTLVRIAEDA